MKEIIEETNQFKRIWIRFWYNDYTRLLFVMCGLHLLITAPIPILLGLPPKPVIIILYILMILLAFYFNDYTNLNRIGLDVHGKKLKK